MEAIYKAVESVGNNIVDALDALAEEIDPSSETSPPPPGPDGDTTSPTCQREGETEEGESVATTSQVRGPSELSEALTDQEQSPAAGPASVDELAVLAARFFPHSMALTPRRIGAWPPDVHLGLGRATMQHCLLVARCKNGMLCGAYMPTMPAADSEVFGSATEGIALFRLRDVTKPLDVFPQLPSSFCTAERGRGGQFLRISGPSESALVISEDLCTGSSCACKDVFGAHFEGLLPSKQFDIACIEVFVNPLHASPVLGAVPATAAPRVDDDEFTLVSPVAKKPSPTEEDGFVVV